MKQMLKKYEYAGTCLSHSYTEKTEAKLVRDSYFILE